MAEAILGLSAYYHDSAAAILVDGKIIAAAQEERFTRKKHDSSFPVNAARYVLEEAGLELDSVEAVAFYDKPYLKFERLLETYHAFAPRGLKSFLLAMPVWIKEKLFMRKMLREELSEIGTGKPKILFPEHHLSHAASAFYPSPFDEAAILTVDGVGEWATTTIGHGKINKIDILRELDFPHSLGLLYSAFTYYCGFKVNSGEYKLMGLSPYGNPDSDEVKKWKRVILEELVDVREDGSFLLNMNYFDYATGLTMCNDALWKRLFGIHRRELESELTQPDMNLALAIQQVTEEILLRLAKTAKEITSSNRLVMAGGVALNCVANGKLIRRNIFEDIWIQPAAGDAGGALGAAYAAWHIGKEKNREIIPDQDSMEGAYLGPEFSSVDVVRIARKYQTPFKYYSNFDELCKYVAELLAQGKIVGWFQGRMEYGPRALGNRSILGDPRHPEMQKRLNLKIKYREGFRPFAPSVLEEDTREYFEIDFHSPYMLLVAPVQKKHRNPLPENYHHLDLFEKLYHLRSDIPAVTHVDYSARIQTVNKNTNHRFWNLINAFKQETGYGMLVNTSFNVRGEPIVCNPDDAYKCFMTTEMDCLVMEQFLFLKENQRDL
ncbi:MAG: carbamoyltransferase [Desulfobacteraceae bacterium Eth-SRB2]|nr:MAG: carbamoyltransferase [Desulfobacteraceae bacterium Eth-SRB2]